MMEPSPPTLAEFRNEDAFWNDGIDQNPEDKAHLDRLMAALDQVPASRWSEFTLWLDLEWSFGSLFPPFARPRPVLRAELHDATRSPTLLLAHADALDRERRTGIPEPDDEAAA